jgi:hypothetical protein
MGGLPATLSSGYQTFVLSLASRLAIWRLAAVPCLDAFIIDEGFGSCDGQNLSAMAAALEALADAPDGPRLVFIVTHIDSLKVKLARALGIEVLATGSRIMNTIAMPAAAAATPAEGGKAGSVPKIAASTAAELALPADPEKLGNVYCESCKRSIRAASGAAHLRSATHAKSLKKDSARIN